MSVTQSQRLKLLSTKARIIREAYLRGEITFEERVEWINEIKEPKTFWGKIFKDL